jgi:hypothetical protein
MLARLLQIRALGRAVERHLALLAATLGADAFVEGRTEAFFFAKVADGTAQKSTSVAGQLPRKSPHYGISVCREASAPAWMLTFRALLWKNPHKIWRKCFACEEAWYTIRQSSIPTAHASRRITNGNWHDQDPARPPHG